ncbi:hypothetical protein [Moritella yayanosii]|uniref:Uncharacterized protein n=1 Tax=Moritella yayanosii TaxID=69539 RepID=A0A330LU29_9GAMM|nr:hypothetical protein [Moritella yayanosii]SQD80454.1 conserved protein of unknown function, 40-50% Identity to uncharacterized protein from Vibrio [Moritella yayanosii]
MNEIKSKSVTLQVSRIHSLGWWLGNSDENVAKGTALGSDFTENVYSPSAAGLTGQYEHATDSWLEVEDKSNFEFWSHVGERFVIGMPDGDYPEWAIKEKPPEYDKEMQTILHEVNKWIIHNIELGKLYWNDEAIEMTVSDFNFTLPADHTFTQPPVKLAGYALRLIDNEWLQVEDHRGKLAYAKNRDSDYEIETLDVIPDNHTLLVPSEFDSWNVILKAWQYDQERERPAKVKNEKSWRDAQLSRVLNRIDEYEKDQGYLVELRTSPFTAEQYHQLLQDRKILSDYPGAENFPFVERPTLSRLV